MDRVARIRELLAASPQDSFLRHALALEYVKAGDDAAARELFGQILHDEPGYVGSYYHLAKLLQRIGHTTEAIDWYKKGMAAAMASGDRHAYGELQGALEDLIDE